MLLPEDLIFRIFVSLLFFFFVGNIFCLLIVIHTSFSTSFRSAGLLVLMNFAASTFPDFFSLQRYTEPNLPLKRLKTAVEINFTA